jgi:putative hydrolase of HD superfamily
MNAEEIIEVCLISDSLKRLSRTGWILAGQNPSESETVASHCWGTAVIALLLAHHIKSQGMSVDIEKLLTMAVLHDLPEAMVSDIPHKAVELGGTTMKSGKREAERSAMRLMLRPLGAPGEMLRKQWDEFEDSKTLEARVVVAADRLDMLAHAVSLESSGFPSQNLGEFFEHAKTEITDLHLDVAQSLFEQLHDMHKNRLCHSGQDH